VEKNPHAERSLRVQRATTPLLVGAIGTYAGVVGSVLGADKLGAGVVLASAALLLWGLHRVGRLGADPPGSMDARRTAR